jgi:two-component system sensor histidine kinase PilS (NtrC family)
MVEIRKNLAWLIFARLVVVSIFLASITYFNIRQPDFFPDEMLRAVTRLIIITYGFSIFSLLACRLPSVVINAVGYTQIVWEIMFVSFLLVITGGISSTYAFFYNLAIINASFIFRRREALYTASLCGIIYVSIINLHYSGRLEKFGLIPISDLYDANQIMSHVFTNLLSFLLTALLTGRLAERARTSETALKVKEIDYEELERLNSLIVSTLDSGLVTINSEGRVRVFNRYASEISGVDQDRAYNTPITDIFPGLKVDNAAIGQERMEFIDNRNGKERVLSAKLAPLQGRDESSLGAVIDFQDITGIREMEAKLKKSDRLAAIGELSARIAHEVRNPLASISGSVQLIAESHAIPEDDRKLLEIVLRETSRLDRMVNEFLQYARPVPPVKSTFFLKPLIEETVALIRGDGRFTNVKISYDTPDSLKIFADFSQLKQVLLNLLLNAAEAIAGEGSVVITAHILENRQNDMNASPGMVEVSVTDTGEGIAENNMRLMFEPFFTTKSGGSGLGLATVYRIIESHNGAISVESKAGNGSRFRITLPIEENTSESEKTLNNGISHLSRGDQ